MRIPGLAGLLKILPGIVVAAIVIAIIYMVVRYFIAPRVRALKTRYDIWQTDRRMKKWQYDYHTKRNNPDK